MRILTAAANYPDPGNPWGVWNRDANIALRAAGNDVETIAPRPHSLPFRIGSIPTFRDLPRRREDAEGPVHHPRFLYLLPQRWFYAWSGDAYRIEVAPYAALLPRPDVIHAHHAFPDGYGLLRMARARKIPMTVNIHGDEFFTDLLSRPALGRRLRRTVEGASHVTTVSERLASLARAHGVPAERVTVVPLGVDTERFAPGERAGLRAKLGIERAQLLLYVGQLVPRKGVVHLLNALHHAGGTALRELHVAIVGDGPERAALEAHARRLGLDFVRFTGRIPASELPLWYAAADAYVLPSLSEGRPMSINEAMASGCAVVATNVSGIPEQVTEGVNGHLVAPEDPRQLAEAIQDVFADPARLARMGRASREKILRDEITWPGYAQRMTRVFERVVSNP